MQKNVSFQIKDVIEIPEWTKDYPSYKFNIYKACFLSDAENTHELIISKEVLMKCAKSILGGSLVAKIDTNDFMSHEPDVQAYGYAPMNQEIEFVEENGITKAYCYFVVSKLYGKDMNEIFSKDNFRNSSVEMSVEIDEEVDENLVVSFDVYGLCVLHTLINGSCPDADVKMVRFSKEEAQNYFDKTQNLSPLKQFVEERKVSMAEEKYVSHPINTTKDAIYEGEWDGEKAKQDLIKEKNYKTLAKKVCLRLEEGWEDREITKLGYPVMGLYDGEWRYSSKALASAQGYAEKNDEAEILDKIKSIKKKLGLDEEGKEEIKMEQVEFSAVNIGNLWSRIYSILSEKRYWNYDIEGIYEEDNKKFAVLIDGGDEAKLYRLDFELTEEGMVISNEIVEVQKEFIDSDTIKKFAEPENKQEIEDNRQKFAEVKGENETPVKTLEECISEIESYKKDIEDKENIIMEKDKELEELRQFKKNIEQMEQANKVEILMSEVKEYLSDEDFKKFREEGLACEKDSLDAWSNSVKATCFSAVKKPAKKNETGVWSFGQAIVTAKVSKGLWD